MAPQLVDPTRLMVVRARAIADLKRRFKVYTGDIRKKIAGEDALGLETQTIRPGDFIAAKTREWKYLSDEEKIAAFALFLLLLSGRTLTGDLPNHPAGTPWTAPYLETAYRRGVMRAYADAKPAVAQDEPVAIAQQTTLLQKLATPSAIAAAIALIYARSRTAMEGNAASMNGGLSSALARGIQNQQSAPVILGTFDPIILNHYHREAGNIRTELTEAHADGQLDAYEEMGIDQIRILAEWRTANQPCKMCSPMAGVLLTVSEARGLIPRHRNCRCCWVMVPINAPGRGGQIRKRTQIVAALRESVRAETHRKRPTSPRPTSFWPGARLQPTQKNPPRRPRP